MTPITSTEREGLQEDPLYRHARREAIVILVAWACCLLYTCTYCYLHGYLSHEPHPASIETTVGEIVGPLESFNRDPATLKTPLGLGVPDWVFYGIVIPWIGCILFTFWFCLFFYVEDDLGRENEYLVEDDSDV